MKLAQEETTAMEYVGAVPINFLLIVLLTEIQSAASAKPTRSAAEIILPFQVTEEEFMYVMTNTNMKIKLRRVNYGI